MPAVFDEVRSVEIITFSVRGKSAFCVRRTCAVEIVVRSVDRPHGVNNELSCAFIDVTQNTVLALPAGLHFSSLVEESPASVYYCPACSTASGLVQVIGLSFDHNEGVRDCLAVHHILHPPGMDIFIPFSDVYNPYIFIDSFFVGDCGVVDSFQNLCKSITCIYVSQFGVVMYIQMIVYIFC